MLRIRARYAGDNTVITGTPVLNWPPFCACCGVPTQAVASLRHVARQSGGMWGPDVGGMSYWVPETGYGMEWRIPCCEACQVHAQKSHHPFSLKWTLVRGGIITMFLGGFGLFSMGIADDPNASPLEILIAVTFVAVNFLAWYGIWKLIGALMRQRGRKFLTARCVDSLAPVSVSSGTQFVRFDFTNDWYAQGVAQVNNLTIERIPFVFPIIGDMLAQVRA